MLVEELKQSEIICYQFFYSVMYPYFFCDLQAIGLGATILWLIALIAIFSVIGLILVWIDSLKLPCRLAVIK